VVEADGKRGMFPRFKNIENYPTRSPGERESIQTPTELAVARLPQDLNPFDEGGIGINRCYLYQGRDARAKKQGQRNSMPDFFLPK